MLKKMSMLLLSMVLVSSYLPLTQVSAAMDNKIPEVQSIQINASAVTVGDEIRIQAKLNDVSGVNDAQVELRTPSNYMKTVRLYYNATTDLWEGVYQIKETDEPGIWTSKYMYVSDIVGNYGSINPALSIAVENTGQVDATIPNVESIQFTSTEASVGDEIRIQAKLNDVSGVNDAQVELRTPSNYMKTVRLYYNATTDLWEGVYEIKETDEPGIWTSKYMYVSDRVGNYGSVNPKLHIVVNNNGLVDRQIPEMEHIQITPSQPEIGETVKIEAKLTDASGVDVVKVDLRTPSNYMKNVRLYYNIATGLWEGTYELKETDEPGIWTSKYMYMSDVVGNYGSVNPSLQFEVKADETAPNMPYVDETIDSTKGLSGTAEPNALVGVKAGDTVLAQTYANSNGQFSLTFTAQPVGTKLSVLAMDASKNISEAKIVTVKDLIAPKTPIVYKVTDASTVITGLTEAYALITVKANTKLIGTVKAEADGTFTLPIAVQQAGTKLTVTAEDASNNVSEAKSVTVTDVTAPQLLTVDPLTDAATVVTGLTEANAKVIAKVDNEIIGTAKAAIDGKYSISIPKQVANTKIVVTAADAANNVSEAKSVTVSDGTAPNKPIVHPVSDVSTVLTGTAEQNSKVIVKANDEVIGEAVAYNGYYEIAIATPQANTQLTVYAIDAASNESERNVVTVIDQTAPQAPTVDAIADNATKITGKAEVNAKVYAMVGNKKIGEATADNGTFTLTIAKQKAGTTVAVYAVDAAGNKGASQSVKVIDKTAPATPTVNAVADNVTKITGKAEVNAKVYAMVGNKKIGEATAKNGTFTITIAKQKAGTTVTVYAVDAAGNKSASKSVKVIDKTPPALPTVSKITSKTVSITGKGEVGAIVYLYNGSKKIAQATVASNGTYKLALKAQKKNTKLVLYAKDKAGNKSTSKTIKVS